MRKQKGFTLIEILFVVGLTGIIAATALAPIVFTVQSLENAQKEGSKNNKITETAYRIFYDARNFSESSSFSIFRIVRRDGFNTRDDDRLLVWSAAPVKENKVPSLIVYKIITSSGLRKNEPGLYRWVIPGWRFLPENRNKEEGPTDLDTENLRPEDGKLILKNAEGVRFAVWSGESWSDEYAGKLPIALKVTITLNGRKNVYEDTLPVILNK
ncbi:MAG: prepilin-type N-terminal cleavage/methylation domain-containing protein [Synergistaceae bacterium]|nr:prepilin-type N-terminal cleavage/methylation domain-containing protein [Synergistaceae bacterium]